MKFTILIIVVLLLISTCLTAQRTVDTAELRSNYTTEASRIKFRKNIRGKCLWLSNNSPSRSNEKVWSSYLREIDLAIYRDSLLLLTLDKNIGYLQNGSSQFQKKYIESLYIFSPMKYKEEVEIIADNTSSEMVFTISVNYLLNIDKSTEAVAKCINLMKEKFSKWESSPVLVSLHFDLANRIRIDTLKTPSIQALLNHNFQDGKTIIFSFHRKDRSYPGLTFIKNPDGNFVQNEDGSIFSIPQLARSVSNLPGYVSQGNTPEGIYSIVGFYITPTESIGPTPIVLTRIPFEVSPKLFYHDESKDEIWRRSSYASLLPEEWKNYFPIFGAFNAGKSGRKLIVMHGSTDDLSFYKNEPYYPLSPSKGCLTSIEIWDEKSGRPIRSDQAELMNAFFSTEKLEGFLVVVDIDEKKKPVKIEEILKYIN